MVTTPRVYASRVRDNSQRLDRVEMIVNGMQARLDAQIEGNLRLTDSMRDLAEHHRVGLIEFRKALEDQENRWTTAHKELTETAITLLQEAMVKALGRKLLDWLWTVTFSGGLLMLGWVSVKFGFR